MKPSPPWADPWRNWPWALPGSFVSCSRPGMFFHCNQPRTTSLDSCISLDFRLRPALAERGIETGALERGRRLERCRSVGRRHASTALRAQRCHSASVKPTPAYFEITGANPVPDQRETKPRWLRQIQRGAASPHPAPRRRPRRGRARSCRSRPRRPPAVMVRSRVPRPVHRVP